MERAGASYLNGAALGLAAVSIWAGWSVITRLAVTTGLDAWDIAALRFGVAGLLLSPVLAQRGLARDRLGWPGLAVLIAGLGAPYALVAAAGLQWAPARDQGALNPGCMPLFVALVAAAVLRERISGSRAAGLSLILVGALTLVGGQGAAWSAWRAAGDALFLVAAFLSAAFTVVMRHARLEPLHAAALVSVGSLAIYLPFYISVFGLRLADRPVVEIAAQAMFQGVVVTIVSLVLYGRAVAILGASGGAAFGALVPALSTVFAIPLLGEWPSTSDSVAVVLISAGVYLTSRGPLPGGRISALTAVRFGSAALVDPVERTHAQVEEPDGERET